MNELRRTIHDAWEELPEADLESLWDSMPDVYSRCWSERCYGLLNSPVKLYS